MIKFLPSQVKEARQRLSRLHLASKRVEGDGAGARPDVHIGVAVDTHTRCCLAIARLLPYAKCPSIPVNNWRWERNNYEESARLHLGHNHLGLSAHRDFVRLRQGIPADMTRHKAE